MIRSILTLVNHFQTSYHFADVEKNTKAVEDYKLGKQNSLQFLAGQVMGKTRGTANPSNVQELLKKILAE